jgi:hypothetical protein
VVEQEDWTQTCDILVLIPRDSVSSLQSTVTVSHQVLRLEVTIWVVPSLIENAVAVATIGLLLVDPYHSSLSYQFLTLQAGTHVSDHA